MPGLPTDADPRSLTELIRRAAREAAVEAVREVIASGHRLPVAPQDQWIDELTAAQRIGVHIVTLRKLRREGRGPAFSKLPPPSRSVRYRASDVDRWIAGAGGRA